MKNINESTHAAFGIINKKGKISSIYIHADGYPEHMVPVIQKYFKTGKAVQAVVNKGGASQLEKPSDMRFYDEDPDTGHDAKRIHNFLSFAGDNYGAEFIYLYDERDGQWKHAGYGDDELRPLEESTAKNKYIMKNVKLFEEFVNEKFSKKELKELREFAEEVASDIEYEHEDDFDNGKFDREDFDEDAMYDYIVDWGEGESVKWIIDNFEWTELRSELGLR